MSGDRAPPSADSSCRGSPRDTSRRTRHCPPADRWRRADTAAALRTLPGLQQIRSLSSITVCPAPPLPPLTFVTEAPPPARFTDALPRLLARSVAAARHRHAALAALPIPAGVTPGNASSQVTGHVTHTYTHKGLTCRAPTRRSGCWCRYSCSGFLHIRTRRRRSQGSRQEAAYQNKSSVLEQEQRVADTRDFICHVMLREVSPL